MSWSRSWFSFEIATGGGGIFIYFIQFITDWNTKKYLFQSTIFYFTHDLFYSEERDKSLITVRYVSSSQTALP